MGVFGRSGGNGQGARRPEHEPALLPLLLLLLLPLLLLLLLLLAVMENQLRQLHAPRSLLINQLAQMQHIQVVKLEGISNTDTVIAKLKT